jgi:hypothetical protein
VSTLPDTPFSQASRTEYLRADVEGFITGTPQPPFPLLAVAVSAGQAYAGANTGLFAFAGGQWTQIYDGGPLYRLLAANGVLYAGTDNAVLVFRGDSPTTQPLPRTGRVRALAETNGQLYVGLEDGLLIGVNGSFTEQADLRGAYVYDLAVDAKGAVWTATDGGLRQLVDGKPVGQWTSAQYLLSDVVQAVAFDTQGRLWIGGPGGLNRLDPDGDMVGCTGAQGLPYLDVVRLAYVGAGPMQGLWVGTTFGLAQYDDSDSTWNYYAGRRWLPNVATTDLAPVGENQMLTATQNGMSLMQFQQQTLAAKAQVYQNINSARHNRDGLVAACNLDLPGDLSTFSLESSNNDGLFTGMYLAALSFQYAATGDPAIRQMADAEFEALSFLTRVSGIPGLPARSVAPLYSKSADPTCAPFCQWQANPTLGFDWLSNEGSDEITGHFFAYSVYYDLAADSVHKPQVAAVVKQVMDYILNNNYYLIDWDGEPTSTGVWNPAVLWQWASASTWVEKAERLSVLGPNGLGILMYLQVARHLTGDAAYETAYNSLIADNALDDFVVVVAYNLLPLLANTFVDQLFYLDYYPLLLYETGTALRTTYLASLARTWSFDSVQGSSLFNAIYGALTGARQDFGLPAAARTLQQIPLDLVEWTMTNSQRADIQVNPIPNLEGQALSDTSLPPLPAGQRAIAKWSDDPYVLDAGAAGLVEEAGTYWLLPYWLARYYGFIEK